MRLSSRSTIAATVVVATAIATQGCLSAVPGSLGVAAKRRLCAVGGLGAVDCARAATRARRFAPAAIVVLCGGAA